MASGMVWRTSNMVNQFSQFDTNPNFLIDYISIFQIVQAFWVRSLPRCKKGSVPVFAPLQVY